MKLIRDSNISKKVLVVGTLSGLFIYVENRGVALKYKRSVPTWV